MKKRSGKKKSNTQNNKPNNSGTTAEVTIAPDKHHNWSRPCSALAHAIMQETLPALQSSNGGIVNCCGGDSAVSSSTCLCFYCQLEVDKDASGKELTTGKLLFTQQPLLAFMILRHMIEERKKTRAAEQEVVDKESADKSTALSSEEELDNEPRRKKIKRV